MESADKESSISECDDGSAYPAKHRYLDPDVPANYESDRFAGALGRYRYIAEQKGVGRIVGQLPGDLTVLDCPCGTGRWWPVLATKAESIVGMDISPAMLEVAEARSQTSVFDSSVELGDAEHIPMEAGSVDLVFSHALMKHLPKDVQSTVLCELSRVSREWVICTFSVFGPISRSAWKRRSFIDSNPLEPHELIEITRAAGLSIIDRRRCSTPIGVEYCVLLRKAPAAPPKSDSGPSS